MKENTSSPFSGLLSEAFSNPTEFQKVMPAATENDSSQVMFKLIQTLANFHDSVADIYAQQGQTQKASYHYQMANRMRAEAQQNKRKL